MSQKCDTCGTEVQEVKRVVIRKDYDRLRSNPVYNCLECYDKKLCDQNVKNESK